ncbi:MAG: hypothetical protein KAJ91_04420, partial [Candidatus Aenigmarchaeota archaeon]|nr:hypothetical protein [Candidatus Aenigmarchaeota archaeon]
VVDNETQLPELPDFAGFTTINIPTEVDASEPITVSGCLAGTENITNENMAELYIDGKILATSILNASGCFEATYTGYFDAGMHQISVRISGTDAGATRLFRLTADVFVESINLPQNIIANQNIKIGAQLSVEATGDIDVSLYVNDNLISTKKNVHIKDRDVVEFGYAFTKAGGNNVTVAAELTGKTDEKTVLAQVDSGTPTGFFSKVLASPLTRISLLLLLVAVWLYLRRKNRRS